MRIADIHQGVAAAQGNFTVFYLHLASKVIVICIKYQIAGTCFGDYPGTSNRVNSSVILCIANNQRFSVGNIKGNFT